MAAVALVAGLLAFRQQRRADTEAARAKTQSVLAEEQSELALANAAQSETRRLVADAAAIVGENRDVALLLASEAYRRDPGPQTLAGLQRVLTSTGPYLGTIGAGHDFVRVSVLGDGTIVGLTRTAVHFFDPTSSALLRSVPVEVSADAMQPAQQPLATDGDRTVIAEADGSVTVIHGAEVRRLRINGLPIRSVAIRRSSIAAGTKDGNVHLLDLETGQIRWSTQVIPEKTYSEAFGPDLWNGLSAPLRDFYLRVEQGSLQSGPPALVIEGAGRVIANAFVNVVALDLATGATLGRSSTPANPQTQLPFSLSQLTLLPNGRILMAGSFKAAVFDDALNLVEDRFVPTGRFDINVSVTSVAVSPAAVPIWGLSDGQVTSGITDSPLGGERSSTGVGTARAVAVASDGSLLVGGTNGIVRWAMEGGGLLARAAPSRGGTVVTLTPDGSKALVGTNATEVKDAVVDLGTSPATLRDDDLLPGFSHTVSSDPLGRYIDAWNNGEVRFLDLETRRPVGKLESGQMNDFSFDGRWLASTTLGSGAVQVFDATTFAPRSPALDLSQWSTAADAVVPGFDSAGRQLFVTHNPGGTTVVFDTTTWTLSRVIEPADHGGVVAARFSRDGSTLVTLGTDGTISLRHPRTWEFQRALSGGVSSRELLGFGLALSQNGEYLLTTRDSKPRLWHLPSSTLIGAFPHKSGLVAGANDLGEQLRLATLDDQRVYFWNLDVSTWPQIACKAAGRNLSRAEWEQFGPKGVPYQSTCPQWAAAA